MASLTKLIELSLPCDCGCNRKYPLFRGMLEYGQNRSAATYIAHFSHETQAPILWVLLGSGPWFEDDDTGCWLVLKNWVANDDLVARIEDWENSPFHKEHIFGERFLTRAEALTQEGGLNWAIARRDDILEIHQPSRDFLDEKPEVDSVDA